MNRDREQQLDTLLAKEEIRELALLYSRGVDRKDPELLRDLYTTDATDTHGHTFDGGAEAYVDFLEQAFPFMAYSGHHICNHLISVDGDIGEGEVYALAYHHLPDGNGGWMEDFMAVRYIDNYRRDSDDRWRFSKRVVTYDLSIRRPLGEDAIKGLPDLAKDPSYTALTLSVFARGKRG
ncbi:nuclear transport factor 2 family protein [Spongiibacter nanhainus]|uniref:Nuclear transport factor 2 family protein n=1 Tax=Spongiibacter nanhainus TaxID=2794344 RepID=A0A7T4UPS7_9GAMM|nr:nuclear transport factor 2 family protein [Spongiibacter nanhainus]QQD17961.1 nuclear transport factor 2 family protein [Spongiibacter nanhainus]